MGRPKGAKNKRTLAVEKFTSAVYGGSAATQSAAFCMVTREELIEAGGDMARARIRKAKRLCDLVKEESGGLQTLTIGQALKLIADELDALKPYTDQKRPQKVELETDGPAVVIMAPDLVDLAAPILPGGDADFVEVFEGQAVEVSQAKSHDGPQPLALPGFEGS